MHGPRFLLFGLALALLSHVDSGCAAPTAVPFERVLVQALVNGRAESQIGDDRTLLPMIAQMKAQTGNPGPIEIRAMRLLRFEQQARCGRVVFGFAQPSSHRAWADLGGQINICEDGGPPLRVCAGEPRILVPATSRCRDKSMPVDTPEVAAAIAQAVGEGGIAGEQLLRKVERAAGSQAPRSIKEERR